MQKYSLYKFTSVVLIILAVSSHFFGFYLNENSSGAGVLVIEGKTIVGGDFGLIWKNLQIFINNDLLNSLNHPEYLDSRLPTAYLMHEFLNPFIETKINFRRSVFLISLIVPVLFFLCLKQRFKQTDNLLLLLVSSAIFLSPYFRTSAYWGLQENYGLIFLLLTFLSLNCFLNNKNSENYKSYFQILFLTFCSSCCFYFDQKLLIIPIICFFQIILSKKNINSKLMIIFLYFIFSIPYIYLVMLWGTLIPPVAANQIYQNKLGGQLYLFNLGYTSTIIGFYIFPILFFLEKNLFNQVKNFFSYKKNYYLLSLFFIYLIYLLNFLDFSNLPILGKGIVHKISIILFDEKLLQEIFTYFSFFISWTVLLIFLNRNLKNAMILLYFLVLSTIMVYTLQEYFDPLILLMAFTFFSSKIIINYKNSTILYIYLSLLLVGSNIYYANTLG